MIEPPTPNADNTIVDSTRNEDSDKSQTYSDNEDEVMENEIESLLKEISQQPDELDSEEEEKAPSMN